MKEIPLSRGRVALIDDEDYERVSAIGAWVVQLDEHTAYARHNECSDGVRSAILMHSLITGWAYVDHRNGDGLDNRRANLREATHAQNMGNKRLYRTNTSGFKGVTYERRGGRWVASIQVNGRKRYLGTFASPQEAAHIYDTAALSAWGEFARINFPENREQAA